MILAGGICIGFAPIGLRLGLSDLGPQAIAFWRYAFAIPCIFLLTVLAGRRLPARPNKFVLLAGIFFACDVAFWHWGLEITTVANATFIVNLGNIMVGFVAWIILKERPAPIWFLAIILAILGAAALSLGGGEGSKGDLRGDGLAFMAAIMITGYVLFSKIARETLGGLETIFWLTCVELVTASLWVYFSGENFLPESLEGLKAPLFLAIIVQTAGQGLIITGLGRTPVSIAGVLIIIQPVVAAIIAWHLFDEPLTRFQFMGAGLILSLIHI